MINNIEYKSLISNFIAETVCRVIFQYFKKINNKKPHFFAPP